MGQKGRPGNFLGSGGKRDSSEAGSTPASDDSPALSPEAGSRRERRCARQEREAADVPLGARIFSCPECLVPLRSPDELGTHIERHRPSEPIEPGMLPCPAGCGRYFGRGYHSETGSIAFREHSKLCDGQPPLTTEPEEMKEATVANPKECIKCGREFKFPSWAKAHAIKCNGERKASSGDDEADPSPVGNDAPKSVKEQTLDFLKEIETHYEAKVSEVRTLIAAVEAVEEPKS